MSTIVTINAGDQISSSRIDINSNFANLNIDKFESSNVDTDTALTANSDTKVPSQKAIRTYVNTVAATTYLVPTGAILPYGGSSAPTNFLLCDGTAVSRVTYATLFGIISTSYGVGNGSTTFNLPDLRGRTTLGAGTGTKVATFASRASNVITVTGLTNAANNEFQTGQAVTYHTTSGVITGLSNDTVYYLIRTGNLTFSLATTLTNAQNATAIALSSDGSGTQTFTQTLTTRAVGDTGGEENHAMSSTELLAHTHTTSSASNISRGATADTLMRGGTGDNISSSTGGNAGMNVMQPFAGVNYIIKT